MTVCFYDLASEHLALRQELDAAFTRVLDAGQFILGTELEAFERGFAKYCGVQDSVGVGNGLDALKLSLHALGIGPGHEVIVAAHTFCATWLAIAETGATPVACEPTPGRFTFSAESVLPLITSRTRAVLPVHLYGIPAPVEEITTVCHEYGLHLIEDAAQAHGATHRGRRCGSFGIAGCFSFYPSKNLGALGDGGAVTTSDEELAERLRRLRNYGSAQKYRLVEVGWNSRLDELQAAMLRVKLGRLDEMNVSRAAAAREYGEALSTVPNVIVPDVDAQDVPAWHLYPIRVASRDLLQKHLAANGIETGIHYPSPVYRMSPFQEYGPNVITESDRLANELLSLPFWPGMPADTIAFVSDHIRKFMSL